MDKINFVAIDFETATFARSSICEIGIAVVRDSIVTEKKSWLVKPKHNYYESFNIEIHGITPSMTKHSPQFNEVWRDVLTYLDGEIVVSHNTSFDMYALKDALDEQDMDYPTFDYFCSMRVARYIIDSYDYKLDTLCDKLSISLVNHHRAGDDAEACAKVFLEALNLSGVNDLDELQEKYAFKKGYFSKAEHVHMPQLSHKHSSVKVGEIIGDASKADPGNYFYGKRVCLTGTMSCGSRMSLLQAIADVGGIPMNSVNSKTDILVVGMQDYKKVGDSGISSKQRKAIELHDNGSGIEIISEQDFLSMIELPELKKASEEELERRLHVAEEKSRRNDRTDTTEFNIVIHI